MTPIHNRVIRNPVLGLGLLMAAVLAVYSNHFHNAFHFDDFHTIISNPYVRELRYLPRFFTDARTFCILPGNQSYRPVVTASIAIDYWLDRSLEPFYFHVSTFCWFLVQLTLIYSLFRKICDHAYPDPRNHWVALFAAAWYGLHPAMAETVNYVIQRADLYVTLGVLAGVWIYAAAPRLRRYGLYLLPFAAGVLSKPPALIFPSILFVYVWMIEMEAAPRKLGPALARCAPALAGAAFLGWLTAAMSRGTFTVGHVSGAAFRLTQPLVALRFFRTFFIPDSLSADSDRVAVASIWKGGNWAGLLFVAAILAAGIAASRRREWRPAAFGIWWFLLAFLPAAIFPVIDVENDHRMFFPFVGLPLAVCWPAALWIYRHPETRRSFRRALALVCAGQLLICGLAARQRNAVWRSEESLWYDALQKSPRDVRAYLNYAVGLERNGTFEPALAPLKRGLQLRPDDALIEINLGFVEGKLKHPELAERHFRRGVQLKPQDAVGRITYADWLESQGRREDALTVLRFVLVALPDVLEGRYLAMRIYSKQANWPAVVEMSEEILHRFPSDPGGMAYRLMAAFETGAVPGLPPPIRSAENLLNLSRLYLSIDEPEKCLAAAKEALKLRPEYSEAYNNMGAALSRLGKWDEAIDAERQALRIQPGFEAAQQNLARFEKSWKR